jgi:hypothetical protein
VTIGLLHGHHDVHLRIDPVQRFRHGRECPLKRRK